MGQNDIPLKNRKPMNQENLGGQVETQRKATTPPATTKYIIAAIAIILLIAGWVYFTHDIRLKREVAAKEVIGVWVLRAESLTTAKQDKARPYSEVSGRIHEIEIRADGTCHYSSITQTPTDFLDCNGMWQLSHAFKDKRIPQLDFLLYRHGSYAMNLFFSEKEGPLVLLQPWGDTDSGDYLVYEKKPAK